MLVETSINIEDKLIPLLSLLILIARFQLLLLVSWAIATTLCKALRPRRVPPTGHLQRQKQVGKEAFYLRVFSGVWTFDYRFLCRLFLPSAWLISTFSWGDRHTFFNKPLLFLLQKYYLLVKHNPLISEWSLTQLLFVFSEGLLNILFIMPLDQSAFSNMSTKQHTA